jgi:hypothetical protein
MSHLEGPQENYDAWTRHIPLCSPDPHPRAISTSSAADNLGRQPCIDQKRQFNSGEYLDPVQVLIKVAVDVRTGPAAERVATDLGPGPAREENPTIRLGHSPHATPAVRADAWLSRPKPRSFAGSQDSQRRKTPPSRCPPKKTPFDPNLERTVLLPTAFPPALPAPAIQDRMPAVVTPSSDATGQRVANAADNSAILTGGDEFAPSRTSQMVQDLQKMYQQRRKLQVQQNTANSAPPSIQCRP